MLFPDERIRGYAVEVSEILRSQGSKLQQLALQDGLQIEGRAGALGSQLRR
jgi:hypothetical protein